MLSGEDVIALTSSTVSGTTFAILFDRGLNYFNCEEVQRRIFQTPISCLDEIKNYTIKCITFL